MCELLIFLEVLVPAPRMKHANHLYSDVLSPIKPKAWCYPQVASGLCISNTLPPLSIPQHIIRRVSHKYSYLLLTQYARSHDHFFTTHRDATSTPSQASPST